MQILIKIIFHDDLTRELRWSVKRGRLLINYKYKLYHSYRPQQGWRMCLSSIRPSRRYTINTWKWMGVGIYTALHTSRRIKGKQYLSSYSTNGWGWICYQTKLSHFSTFFSESEASVWFSFEIKITVHLLNYRLPWPGKWNLRSMGCCAAQTGN